MGPFTEESDGETAGVLILLVPTVSFTVFSEQTQLCGFEWFFNFSKIRSAESRTRPWPLARLTTVDRSFNGTPCGCWGIIEECGKRPQCVADRCSLLVTRSRSSISLAPKIWMTKSKAMRSRSKNERRSLKVEIWRFAVPVVLPPKSKHQQLIWQQRSRDARNGNLAARATSTLMIPIWTPLLSATIFIHLKVNKCN